MDIISGDAITQVLSLNAEPRFQVRYAYFNEIKDN